MARTETPAKAHANLASIQKIPREVLLHGSARLYLIRCAEAGEDVRAERSVAGEWSVWVRNARFTAREWAQHYYRSGGQAERSA